MSPSARELLLSPSPERPRRGRICPAWGVNPRNQAAHTVPAPEGRHTRPSGRWRGISSRRRSPHPDSPRSLRPFLSLDLDSGSLTHPIGIAALDVAIAKIDVLTAVVRSDEAIDNARLGVKHPFHDSSPGDPVRRPTRPPPVVLAPLRAGKGGIDGSGSPSVLLSLLLPVEPGQGLHQRRSDNSQAAAVAQRLVDLEACP